MQDFSCVLDAKRKALFTEDVLRRFGAWLASANLLQLQRLASVSQTVRVRRGGAMRPVRSEALALGDLVVVAPQTTVPRALS